MKGKVVLVTGANGGLGVHVTTAFLNAGATVVHSFGRLDVLAHTVGGFAGGQALADTDDATWNRMLDMNLHSTFHILRATLPMLKKARSARIIAIGSRAAVDPGPNVAAYSASKAAMVSLIRTVALENKDAGLTANVILPGTIDTPANRAAMPKADYTQWVQPSNIASLMVWLASDAAQDVNGAVIPVYGAGL
jgi:NAD(P)-dependent dehydrogenase (short-subunit alcohol dehydrogenase family)